MNTHMKNSHLLLFHCEVLSDSLRPHEPQHARLPCPSLSPRICSNWCSLHWWCHLTISSSVTPFSSCPQYFPGSGSFAMSWLFASSGQSIRVSALVFPINIQGWFSLGWTGFISLLSKGLSKESSPAPQFENIHSSVASLLYSLTLISIHGY